MNPWTRIATTIVGVGFFAWTTAGCSGPPTAAGGVDAGRADALAPLRTDTCASEGFRAASPGSVICPGTPTCSCPASQICCLQAIDSTQGACQSFESCRAIALTCTGPDGCSGDAGDGGVCCLDQGAGGGTLCRASAGACPSKKILCRTDDDCTTVTGQPYCRPADFGTQGVADRGLDGLIGVCAAQ